MSQIPNSISVPSSSVASVYVREIDRLLPYLAAIWFFVSIDSIFVWNSFSSVIHIFTAIGVIWGSVISKSVTFLRKYRLVFFLLFCYLMWILSCLATNLGFFVKRICVFAPFLFMLFWSKDLLSKSYLNIRKAVLFFAIGASVVSILSLIGLISRVPHFVMPPQEALHERFGYVYYVYGLFVTIQDPAQMLIYRACGMMKEPGHFAVVLGFVYLIDRYQGRKMNKWLVLCGLLTFSFNFVLILLFTEFHNILKSRNTRKIVKWVIFVLLGIYILFLFLPSDIQDQIYYLFYGRNLETVFNALSSSSSINEALDERANDIPLTIYNKMSINEMFFGIGGFDTAYCLSDYRGMIMATGFVGLILSNLAYFIIIRNARKALTLSLLMSFLLVLMHRSWMLYFPYIYYLSLLAVGSTLIDNDLEVKPMEKGKDCLEFQE